MSVLLYIGAVVLALLIGEWLFRRSDGGSAYVRDVWTFLAFSLWLLTIIAAMAVPSGAAKFAGALLLIVFYFVWRGSTSRLGWDEKVRRWLSGGI